MKNITIKLYSMLFLLVMTLSCSLPNPSELDERPVVVDVNTIILEEEKDTIPDELPEISYYKKLRLEKEHIDSALVDSVLLLGMKSGIKQKEFDRIIKLKGVTKKVIKEDDNEHHHYEFKLLNNIPNIYGYGYESMHKTTGLAGFDIEVVIRNNIELNSLAQELIDLENEEEEEVKKQKISDIITGYQSKIIEEYKYIYGEPMITDSKFAMVVWFFGRKMIELSILDLEEVIDIYEAEREICVLDVSYIDLKLIELYRNEFKKDYKEKSNI